MTYNSIQENITILNMYVPNNRVAKCEAKMIEMKRETDKYTSVIGD